MPPASNHHHNHNSHHHANHKNPLKKNIKPTTNNNHHKNHKEKEEEKKKNTHTHTHTLSQRNHQKSQPINHKKQPLQESPREKKKSPKITNRQQQPQETATIADLVNNNHNAKPRNPTLPISPIYKPTTPISTGGIGEQIWVLYGKDGGFSPQFLWLLAIVENNINAL